MAPPNTNLIKSLLPLGVLLAARRLDATDETTLLMARVYGATVLVFLMLFYYFYMPLQVMKNPDKDKLVVVQPKGKTTKTMQKKKANPADKNVAATADNKVDDGKTDAKEVEEKKVTVFEYDKGVLKERINMTLMFCTIIPCVHYYSGSLLPMLMPTTINLMNAFFDPLVKIYVFHKTETEDKSLKRPFPSNSPFAALMKPKNE